MIWLISCFFCYLQIVPPFKPQVTSDTDTRYFDSEFTGESVELTPPELGPLSSISEELEQPYFSQFSYQEPSSTLSGSLAHSMQHWDSSHAPPASWQQQWTYGPLPVVLTNASSLFTETKISNRRHHNSHTFCRLEIVLL